MWPDNGFFFGCAYILVQIIASWIDQVPDKSVYRFGGAQTFMENRPMIYERASLLYFFYRIHLSFVGEKSSEDELLSRAISSPTSLFHPHSCLLPPITSVIPLLYLIYYFHYFFNYFYLRCKLNKHPRSRLSTCTRVTDSVSPSTRRGSGDDHWSA